MNIKDDKSYEKYINDFADCNIPCGSEWSLGYRVDIVGSGLVFANVALWGDLRDYDNEEEIKEWLIKNFEYNEELEKNELVLLYS